MPAIYDLIKDYGSPDMVVSMAPVWVLAVVRWSHPFVFDRIALTSSPAIDAFEQVQKPVIITSDCTALDISGNKGSHVANLTAVLRDSETNYLSSFYPDDWLLAWILPNETRARNLLQKLSNGEQCNGFQDGLKFFGRINTCFKDTIVDDDGKPTSIYNLTGVGFGEFDYQLFWEPLLELPQAQESLPIWYQRLGIFLSNVVLGSEKSVAASKNSQGIDVNKMIPALVRLVLGDGPFQGDHNLAVPGGANASPNGGIRVPSLVGKLLGLVDTADLTYSDLVDIVVGVQKYQGAAGAPQDSPLIFQPDGLQNTSIQLQSPGSVQASQPSNTAEYQTTGIPLLGEFPVFQLTFQDTPIWRILEHFLNPSMNEMFITLKPDQYGDVFPRLTVRQYPFNTLKFANSNPVYPVTAFLELPRWRVDPKMLKRIQVGRSNALRGNFWHVQTTGPGMAITREEQYVGPGAPKSDRNDVERSGLRRVVLTVNCFVRHPGQVAPWRDMVVDRTAGQQLTLTGVLVTAGIPAPISVGDNIQFANVVYHVEQVTHSCSTSPRGKRDWKTTMQVTHGMADETTLGQNQQDTALDVPLQEYAGVRNVDPGSVRVGHSVYDDKLGST